MANTGKIIQKSATSFQKVSTYLGLENGVHASVRYAPVARVGHFNDPNEALVDDLDHRRELRDRGVAKERTLVRVPEGAGSYGAGVNHGTGWVMEVGSSVKRIIVSPVPILKH
jgi:hypothetical protein